MSKMIYDSCLKQYVGSQLSTEAPVGTTTVQPQVATTAVEAVLPNTEGTTTEPTNPFAAMISELGITGVYCKAFWVNFGVSFYFLING